ncbi:MAG TPA: PEP-CTERM sorting domain-containing protein [Candidatus Acidoferrales bacterium]|nr:PEP-CTERM sorting domain-containing protein [Candidatus Acidoferrales bacterium]
MKVKMVVLAGMLLAAAPVFASGLTIDFSHPNTISGDTATYTVGSNTVTAVGYECSDSTLQSGCSTSGLSLFAKLGGVGETGLGISNGGDNEIDSDQFIQFDFGQLAHMGITSLTFNIESVQDGEGFRIFQSDAAGDPEDLLTTVTGNGSNNPNSIASATVTVSLDGDNFIDISSLENADTSNDVLVGGASSPNSATPEPGTLVLFGTGLLVAGFGLRRRSAGQSA